MTSSWGHADMGRNSAGPLRREDRVDAIEVELREPEMPVSRPGTTRRTEKQVPRVARDDKVSVAGDTGYGCEFAFGFRFEGDAASLWLVDMVRPV
jgi:hypothetical protein